MSQDKEENLYQSQPHLLAFVDTLGFYKEIQKQNSEKIDAYLGRLEQLKESWTKRAKQTLKLSTIRRLRDYCSSDRRRS